MKVFLTGATGVLGRRAVPALVEAGLDITAVSRSSAKDVDLERAGAKPVRVDLFDPAAVSAAVVGHDAVVNLATNIPPPSKAAFSGAWATSNRLRSEGASNLVDAALHAGVGVFVQESVAFLYQDSGDKWLTEDDSLDIPKLGEANISAETQCHRFAAAGGNGVVLRFGQFYAWESVHTQYLMKMARRRLPGVPGPRGAFTPAVAADDAARAVAAALRLPSGTWNVVDDDPLTRQAYNRAVADAIGAKPARGTGSFFMKLSANTRFYLRSQRVSNQRFRADTSWVPAYPNARVGWAEMASQHRGP